jgi:hypothetical protein
LRCWILNWNIRNEEAISINPSVIVLIIISLLVIVAILQLIFEHTSGNIGIAIIEAGIALVLAGIPSVLETLISFVGSAMNVPIETVSERYLYVCMTAGSILIIFGVVILIKMKEHIFILNMLGINKREISDKKALKELKLADYKVKEQLLDFIPVFVDGQKMDDRANRIITEQIEAETKRFSDRTNNEKSCFTGMAPIPYTVFAGTFLGKTNLCRYFEFNRLKGEVYYELKKKKFWNPKWDKLKEVTITETDVDATDVVLAISVSHMVQDADLVSFNGKDIIRLQVDLPADNIIRYTEQLLEYKQVINEYLDAKIKQRYNKLKRVHIVASIPSCMSLEIGKSIGMGLNRMPEIIVYHYISSSEKKYPYGIFVSGDKKGKLMKN